MRRFRTSVTPPELGVAGVENEGLAAPQLEAEQGYVTSVPALRHTARLGRRGPLGGIEVDVEVLGLEHGELEVRVFDLVASEVLRGEGRRRPQEQESGGEGPQSLEQGAHTRPSTPDARSGFHSHDLPDRQFPNALAGQREQRVAHGGRDRRRAGRGHRRRHRGPEAAHRAAARQLAGADRPRDRSRAGSRVPVRHHRPGAGRELSTMSGFTTGPQSTAHTTRCTWTSPSPLIEISATSAT